MILVVVFILSLIIYLTDRLYKMINSARDEKRLYKKTYLINWNDGSKEKNVEV